VSDVLSFASLAEGCSLVTLEGLAWGVPVIVTPNTGTIEFITDGFEGFVVPICSGAAIVDRLNTLNDNRELLAATSHNAHRAAQAHSLELYRTTCVETVEVGACQ
jgi:glycosyltransferase involved in cell wall biosynthesis